MTKQSIYNFLLVGRTGSGKSELINYLAGKTIAKTGVGKPVTPKGEFKEYSFPFPSKPNTRCKIYDSWGLESSQSDVWEQVIQKKLDTTLDWNKIISGIIYCISYRKDRLQDFERDYIKQMLKHKYRVIVACTNADSNNYPIHCKEWPEDLKTFTKEENEHLSWVDISSKPYKLRGKEPTQPFGRDKLVELLKKDMDFNIASVLLQKALEWKKSSSKELNDLADKLHKKVNDIGFFLSEVDYKKEVLTKELEKDIRKCERNIESKFEGITITTHLAKYLPKEKFTTWKQLLLVVIGGPLAFTIMQIKDINKLKEQLHKAIDERINPVRKTVNQLYAKIETECSPLVKQNKK